MMTFKAILPIEAFLNEKLKASNINAKAIYRDDCLRIMLESKEELSQVHIVDEVKELLRTINPEKIKQVIVYAKLLEDDFPIWDEQFEFLYKRPESGAEINSENVSQSQEKATSAKSSESDVLLTSIISYISSVLNNDSHTISITRAGIVSGCLELEIKSRYKLSELKKQNILSTVKTVLNKFDDEAIVSLSLTIKDSLEDEAKVWNKKIDKNLHAGQPQNISPTHDKPNSNIFSNLKSNLRLISILGVGITLVLGVIFQDIYYKNNEKQIEVNQLLKKDVTSDTGNLSPKDKVEALERLTKYYKRTPILIPSFLRDNSYKCVGLFDTEGQKKKKEQEELESSALTEEELSIITKAEWLSYLPVKILDLSINDNLNPYTSSKKSSSYFNYWRLAVERITNEIDCGNDNPKTFLRQYDFSNEKYPYIIKANAETELNTILFYSNYISPSTPEGFQRYSATNEYS
jgi:hypothetical protein